MNTNTAVSPASSSADGSELLIVEQERSLDIFFKPRSVALIGATETENSVGRTVLQNLLATPFGGTVYPVNPRRAGVLGVRAYARVADVPERVDLAVIATPAPTVAGLIEECINAGVRGAVILSAGFEEAGAAGTERSRQVLALARRHNFRIIGPNCLGVMSPRTGLNATFAHAMARPGKVAFLSQSGALCTAILDWSLRENVGFSAFVSLGSMIDVGWGDLIDYLADDPHTESILLYMESVGDARRFLSAAREAALAKPILVLKAGRTEAGAKAAASHTGTLTGSDAVLDAAFQRSGVLRVGTIAELFYMAEVLAAQPAPRGPRLTILTNAGGPGVLAADSLIAGGGRLATLSEETREAMSQALPAHAGLGNPIDILGDADPERYAGVSELAAQNPDSDGLLVILTPQAMTDPTRTAEWLANMAKKGTAGKPILASWMGGAGVAAGIDILHHGGIPVFPYPDTAARVFTAMWRHSDNLRALYETPAASPEGDPDPARAEALLRAVQREGRTLLAEHESKQLLAAYGIPAVETHVAATEEDAVRHADALGYPVVAKLFSETITHKTDVGGVHLRLRDAEAVRGAYRAIAASVAERVGREHFLGVTIQPMIDREDAYELILGSSVDPQFGPVLLFGAGGQMVEVFADRAIGLPPLTTTLARRMMEQTRIYEALGGIRGRRSVDLPALEQILVRFARLVLEQPRIKEIDINPLLASSERLIALDARVVLHEPGVDDDALPRPAIRPYPTQYVDDWSLRDGTPVTLRPIRPEDEPLMVRFHETLSAQSVYARYFRQIRLSQRVAHQRLSRLCFVDYDREIALVALRKDPRDGGEDLMAVGRLVKQPGGEAAEFALLVADPYQQQGLGGELLRRLIGIARDEGLRRVTADILPENQGMLHLCREQGFRLVRENTDDPVTATLDLAGAA